MREYVYKWKSDDYWRLPEYEAWLQDMAVEGLHLEKLGLKRGAFIKGESRKVSYRIEPILQEKVFKENKEKYLKKGWEFVCSDEKIAIFRTPEVIGEQELYTMPKEQEKILQRLYKKLKIEGIVSGLVLLLWMGIVISGIYLEYKQEGMFINIGALWGGQVFVLAMYSSVEYNEVKGMVYVRRLIRQLQKGEWIAHTGKWSQWKGRIIRQWLFIISAILLSMVPIIGG